MAKPDPNETFEQFTRVHRQMVETLMRQFGPGHPVEPPEIFKSLNAGLLQDIRQFNELQSRYYRSQLELWLNTIGQPEPPAAGGPQAHPGDKRFAAREWSELPYFHYLKQAYLLNSSWLMELVESAKLEAAAKRKLRFLTRQLIDAMAPSNFPATNPEAIKLAAETDGNSVVEGLRNLGADLEKGRVSMTDEAAFEVGRNLAVTEGAVIFENELIQLIQYRPLTETVHQRPLLMVPPCINKFYILDLQPGNSLVRFALEQGFTVFMVSWRNMPPALGRTTWDDYVEQGVIRAIEVTRAVCGTERINVLGFCVGGTLLGCALAVLRARDSSNVEAVTLLASMLDFSDTGEISVYVDEAYVHQAEETYRDGGVMPGQQLATTFASLRANDLIWYYVVNNYLKGRQPAAFDLLYWNSDGANLSGAMYAYYVRNMYLENKLREPGRLTMCGAPVDLGSIGLPTYVLATREDHIVPWQTAYASARLLRGEITFVLAASGHIAGVINPASKNRRNFWLNAAMPDDAGAWLAGASSQPGSWWTHWGAWLKARSGEQVRARSPLGGAGYTEIEAAPGRYVKERPV